MKIRAINLKLSVPKCVFGEVEVEYQGTMVRHEIFVNPCKIQVQTLRGLPAPTPVPELQSVLGAFSFIQRWLPGHNQTTVQGLQWQVYERIEMGD